ncbi:hypothetical protein [Geothrix sp. 21YS21S-2]|uniref:hypothetical protein n=1 Tax=Geothrix sp. 21YS21S-2 TaxID=3068893 RepID=UPI0027BA4039|nr:hypothetical protein [Geothrix sp. 21YS21S-2]
MLRTAVLSLCLLVGCAYTKVIFQKVPDTSYPASEARAAVLEPLDGTGVERWREAGRRIMRALQADHPDPWSRFSREAFLARVADLDQDLPRLSEYQAALRWKRILARLGDAHTALRETATSVRSWPLRTSHAQDGLRIILVAHGQEALLGARVVAVGGEPVDDYLHRLEPFIADPVPSKRRQLLAGLFPVGWAWLEALGELPGGAQPLLELEDREGKRFEARMEVGPEEGRRWATLPGAWKRPRDLEPDRYYAFRLLQEDRTLYLRYARCRNRTDDPMKDFLGRMAEACRNRPVARIVVDLRGNAGGDERVFAPVLRWIRNNPAFSRPGGTWVLTDAGTHSSGHGAARRLKGDGALLAGGETGQPDNAFGQVHFTVLPGLRPVFGCSVRRFLWDKGNPEGWQRGLIPDVLLEPTVEDVLGLSDTVLDRVLARPFPLQAPGMSTSTPSTSINPDPGFTKPGPSGAPLKTSAG